MAYVKDSAHKALAKRLDPILTRLEGGERPRYGPDDLNVLRYIRGQLTPTALKRRGEEDTNMHNLHKVAAERLGAYESEDA